MAGRPAVFVPPDWRSTQTEAAAAAKSGDVAGGPTAGRRAASAGTAAAAAPPAAVQVDSKEIEVVTAYHTSALWLAAARAASITGRGGLAARPRGGSWPSWPGPSRPSVREPCPPAPEDYTLVATHTTRGFGSEYDEFSAIGRPNRMRALSPGLDPGHDPSPPLDATGRAHAEHALILRAVGWARPCPAWAPGPSRAAV